MPQFELVVQDVAGIDSALRIAPDRIELCQALSTGGLTPSAALIAQAVDAGLNVHVLIRPREGGFEYSAAELRASIDDAKRALDLGANGVVVGALADARINSDFIASVVAAADGAEVTMHRAFDQLTDQVAGLETLLDLGVTRVLTSGGAPSAAAGADQLRSLVVYAAGRLQIMAGAGVNASNAASVAATGVAAVHASAKCDVSDEVGVSVGSAPSIKPGIDEAEALAIKRALAQSLA